MEKKIILVPNLACLVQTFVPQKFFCEFYLY